MTTSTTTPTPSCRDVELLLSLAASGEGALDADESARLDAHLAACAACRAEAEATAGVLALAKLPPPSDDERRVHGGLPASLLEVLRRRERRRGLARPFLAGVAVAAAAAAFVLAPALLRKEPSPPPAAEAVAAQPGWEEPDLDRLWEDAGVLDWEDDAALAGGWDTGVTTNVAYDR